MAYDPIDEKLESAAQRTVQRAVRDLPEETPNMAWRGALSARIAAEAKRSQRRRWFLNVGRPAIGLAATACLAAVVLVRGNIPQQVKSGRSLEAALVQAHRESQTAFDVAGSGLGNDPLEATPASFEGWDESDVEAF
ncbi:hypothetical protein EON79_03850 [bacterium]|nr:MAG: hypothetical protein EON79_03850 [bacterium]